MLPRLRGLDGLVVAPAGFLEVDRGNVEPSTGLSGGGQRERVQVTCGVHGLARQAERGLDALRGALAVNVYESVVVLTG